jgi:hypothetical protein
MRMTKRGETTPKADGEVSKRDVFGLLRGGSLIAALAGAGASLAFMLRAGRRQSSRILSEAYMFAPILKRAHSASAVN